MAPRRVVVLGSTGFIGKAIVESLGREAATAVHGYSSETVDLDRPETLSVLREVADAGTTIVFAARSRDRTSTLDALEANTRMLVNVARFLERHPVGRFVYLSSTAVYGDARDHPAITETTPVEPASYYAIAKYAGELILGNVARDHGVPLLILRPCGVYGPSDEAPPYGPTRFIASILEERAVHLYGDGDERRDHLYIDDLAGVMRRFVLGELTGTYNVASGRSYAYRDIVERLREIVPHDFRVLRLPQRRRFGHQGHDIGALSRAMPEARFTTIEQGLRATYEGLARRAGTGAGPVSGGRERWPKST